MIARHIGLFCLAAWLGASAFFSFALAPAAFRVLPRDQAGKLLGELFPIYYHIGLALGLTALACCWIDRSAHPQLPYATPRLVLLLTFNALLLVSAYLLLPWIHDLREQLALNPTPELKARFGMAHGCSMAANLLALLIALTVFLLTL